MSDDLMISMNTIEAYENDIFKQPKFLDTFRIQNPISKPNQKNVIFSGTGDSFASAMLAEAFSNYLVKAIDPLELINSKTIVNSKTIYFVSISGNTISNIKAAKIAKKSIAISSKPESRLVNTCDGSIILTSTSDVFTAGSISFLESALTCISLVIPLSIPKNHLGIFQKALFDAKKSKLGKRIFVLGSMYTLPIALYCTAKFYEILGYDVHFQRIEQFSHMELFSAKKGDTVIIFDGKNSHTKLLVKNLKSVGLNVLHPTFESKNKISQLLYYVFLSQLLPLFEAKKRGKKECHFILSKKFRNVSNRMIY
ncbi:MAG: SIS domain-containing protein [Nitrosarchaeum sp.]